MVGEGWGVAIRNNDDDDDDGGRKGSAVSSGGVEIANHHTHDRPFTIPTPERQDRRPGHHTTYTSRCDGLKASYPMTARWETGSGQRFCFVVSGILDNLGFFDFKRLMPAPGKEGGIIIRMSHTHRPRPP